MSEPAGLMAFYADFEPQDVEPLRAWHNCEHMAERVSIPGFLSGARYRGLDTPERFLMMYETETAAVLGSAPYHDALNNPTPWTKQALTWFRNPARGIYSLMTAAGAPAWRTAPFMLTLRFNLKDGSDRGALDPAALVESGAQRARLFAIDEAISGMMTSERKIYSGGPGEQEYLLMVELMEPFDAFSGLPDAPALTAKGCTDIFADRLAIDFALEAPR